MVQEPACRSDAFFTRMALAIAALLLLASICLVTGWYAEAALMQSLELDRRSLTASVGVGLCLAGLSLALHCLPEALRWPAGARRRHVANGLARVLALMLVVIGVVALFERLMPLSSHLHHLLAAPLETVRAVDGAVTPLSVTIAFGFLMAGLCLVMLDVRLAAWEAPDHFPAEYGAVCLMGAMGIPLTAALYSAAAAPVGASLVVPLHLPVVFVVLATGILAARPRHRLMAVWSSMAPGGHLLRQLLPQSLVLLISLDLLVEWGGRHGYYGREQVAPLFILLSAGWLSILFWRAATLLNREHAVRRQGEAALFETSALLRAVSDNTPDGIFIRDRDGRFIFANPALAAVFGKATQDLVGRTSSDVLADPADAELIAASDHAVIDAGRALAVEETLHVGGATRTFYSTKAPWLGYRGELLGVVGISTDITERKRIEDALRAHETQLEALVAARTAEVSELIGHLESTREEEKRAIARELHDELGSALTALSMHLTMLFQQMPHDSALDDRAQQVRSLLSAIVQTTRRIQRGLRPDKLDIFGIKIAIAEQVNEFADYTGIACKVSVPDEEIRYAPAVDIALFRMVQEALNNIAKHARAAQVTVVLDDTEDTIILTVRDNGVGLPTNFASTTATHGLRGMRERAGYLGGSVNVTSGPGQGTTVRVQIPKAQAHRTPARNLSGDRGVPAGAALNPA